MPSERQMWQDHVRPVLQGARLDPVRIENSAALGTPDVFYLFGWIELKHLDEWPKREATIVRIPHFTPQQRVVLGRRWRCGGHSWLLLRVCQEFFLFDGVMAQQRVGVSLRRSDLAGAATVHDVGFTPKFLGPLTQTRVPTIRIVAQ